MKKFVLAAALLGSAMATPSSAATIVGLFNTGANATGTGTVGGNGADLHWSLVGGTAYNGGTNGSFPIPPWIAEDNVSRWLTPTSDASNSQPATSTYTLTFDLTGYKASTATFMFRAAADDSGIVSLNGGTSYAIGGFTSFSGPFTVGNGFNAGVNTITFNVANTGGGPSGARLEFLSSSVAAVPEPATWAMMMLGFGMVGFGLRTRRNAKVATRVTYA